MNVSLALVVLAGVAGLQPPPQVIAPKKAELRVVVEKAPNKPMYTTYFYTAAEAIVHGYEADTRVRVVSLEKRGTIWEGVVGPGDTRVVQTGQGVFGFIADKKATILVGTPTSCTVVGYYLKDEL